MCCDTCVQKSRLLDDNFRTYIMFEYLEVCPHRAVSPEDPSVALLESRSAHPSPCAGWAADHSPRSYLRAPSGHTTDAKQAHSTTW